jgi:methionyl-tRNA formyltransferase
MCAAAVKIVYFGTPPFAAEILTFLIANGLDIAAVITKPDRPQGRSGKPVPTAVKVVTLEAGIPLFQPPLVSDPAFAPQLQAFGADLFVVVAYGELIKQHLLDMPRYGCINVHASLLPKYRGAAPIQRSIIDGNVLSGVTIMQMVRKMDAGDMITTATVTIGETTTYGELEQALCSAAKEPLLAVLEQYAAGVIPDHQPQDHAAATIAPKIELEDCQIDWRRSAEQLHNLIRGVNPEPGAWCFLEIKGERKRLKIWRSSVVEGGDFPPGSLIPGKRGELIVACGERAVRILELQMEGKRRVTAEQFLSGISPSTISIH